MILVIQTLRLSFVGHYTLHAEQLKNLFKTLNHVDEYTEKMVKLSW